jgi:hypothetical protein
LTAKVFRDRTATRENRDVLEHEGRERFAVHVFRDDHERTSAARHLLEQGGP